MSPKKDPERKNFEIKGEKNLPVNKFGFLSDGEN